MINTYYDMQVYMCVVYLILLVGMNYKKVLIFSDFWILDKCLSGGGILRGLGEGLFLAVFSIF